MMKWYISEAYSSLDVIEMNGVAQSSLVLNMNSENIPTPFAFNH
jgi:hypothetical protein